MERGLQSKYSKNSRGKLAAVIGIACATFASGSSTQQTPSLTSLLPNVFFPIHQNPVDRLTTIPTSEPSSETEPQESRLNLSVAQRDLSEIADTAKEQSLIAGSKKAISVQERRLDQPAVSQPLQKEPVFLVQDHSDQISPLSEQEFLQHIDNSVTSDSREQNSSSTQTQIARERRIPGHAATDLDLALENFFYALEDLVQSASRSAAERGLQQSTYVAQVDFPVEVMVELESSLDLDTGNTDQLDKKTAIAKASTKRTTSTLVSIARDFDYKPYASVSMRNDNNLFSSQAGQTVDQVIVTDLGISAEAKSRTRSLKFDTKAHAGKHLKNSADDYVDASATASYTTLLGEKSKGFAGIGFFSHHGARGEISSAGLNSSLSEPVQFESTVLRGIYEQGTKRTRSRFTLDSKLERLRTKNFHEFDGIRSQDRDIQTLIGTAFYNWSQRMALLVELRQERAAYSNDSIDQNLDGTQTRYAGGVEWLATRKTAGSVRVGFQERDFDDPSRQDTKNVSWQAVVKWTPRPRSEVAFETQRDIDESGGFATARHQTDYKITWKQRWHPRFSTSASAQQSKIDFVDENREDELSLVNATLKYSVMPDMSVVVKLTYVDNQSNVTEFNFDRSMVEIGLDYGLGNGLGSRVGTKR